MRRTFNDLARQAKVEQLWSRASPGTRQTTWWSCTAPSMPMSSVADWATWSVLSAGRWAKMDVRPEHHSASEPLKGSGCSPGRSGPLGGAPRRASGARTHDRHLDIVCRTRRATPLSWSSRPAMSPRFSPETRCRGLAKRAEDHSWVGAPTNHKQRAGEGIRTLDVNLGNSAKKRFLPCVAVTNY